MNSNVIFISSSKSGYSPTPDSCGHTMTVQELREVLEQFDGDTPVYLLLGYGYGRTYGSITENSIQEDEVEL